MEARYELGDLNITLRGYKETLPFSDLQIKRELISRTSAAPKLWL